jgi:hypothetical protein
VKEQGSAMYSFPKRPNLEIVERFNTKSVEPTMAATTTGFSTNWFNKENLRDNMDTESDDLGDESGRV